MNYLRQSVLSVLAVVSVLFAGSSTASADSTTETWYVSYVFTYKDASGKDVNDVATEPMEFRYDEAGNVAFYFPNPITGNAWMQGIKSGDELVFSNGQYIGKYGSENAYYCGSDGQKLTDITFLYNAESNSYLCMSAILINSSLTKISAWGYFSTVLVSKEAPSDDISKVLKDQQPKANGAYYDLQGRRVNHPAKGLYIFNGKKVLMK
jgi:hypothetical protein